MSAAVGSIRARHVAARWRLVEHLAFWSLLLLAVLPIWLVTCFPSNDGPEHLHNAFVLLRLNAPGFEVFRQYYQINPVLSPNWAGHLVLAVLLAFLPPLIAEKVLLTTYLIAFPLAWRYALGAVRREGRYLSLLGFPLAYNWFFHMGFYNFCFALAGFLACVGYFLKHRRTLTWPQLTALGTLLLGLYFCHLSAVIMALGVIGALALWQCRTEGLPRRHLWRLGLMALPVMALVFWFFAQPHAPETISPPMHLQDRLRYFFIFLCSFSRIEVVFSLAIVLSLAALALGSLARRQRFWSGLLLLLAGLILFSLAIPANISRGGFVVHRLMFFTVLLGGLYGASVHSGRRFRRGMVVGSIMLSLCAIGYYATQYHYLNSYLREYLSAGVQIPEGSTVLPILLEINAKSPDGKQLSYATGPFRHAAGYWGAGKAVVDLDNYEGEVGYFPIIWRPEVNPFQRLADGDFTAYAARTQKRGAVDYIYIWRGAPADPQDERTRLIRQRLAQGYRRIMVTSPCGYGELWRHQ